MYIYIYTYIETNTHIHTHAQLPVSRPLLAAGSQADRGTRAQESVDESPVHTGGRSQSNSGGALEALS